MVGIEAENGTGFSREDEGNGLRQRNHLIQLTQLIQLNSPHYGRQ